MNGSGVGNPKVRVRQVVYTPVSEDPPAAIGSTGSESGESLIETVLDVAEDAAILEGGKDS